MTRRAQSRGVTLIEMLVVVAILGVLSSVAYPSITAGLDSLRLNTAADDVASRFQAARNYAEQRQQMVEMRIEPRAITLIAPGLDRRLDLEQGMTIVGDPRTIFIDPQANPPAAAIEIHNSRGSRIVRLDPITGFAEVSNPPSN